MDRTLIEFVKSSDAADLNVYSRKEYVTKFLIESFLKREYHKLFDEKDAESVDAIISITSWFDLNQEFIIYYCKLLAEPWHFSHESLVSAIQFYKPVDAVPYLRKAIEANFSYIQINGDQYSFIRKCLFALGDINSAEALELIEHYYNSTDKQLSSLAAEQINRKKPGS